MARYTVVVERTICETVDGREFTAEVDILVESANQPPEYAVVLYDDGSEMHKFYAPTYAEVDERIRTYCHEAAEIADEAYFENALDKMWETALR